MIGAVRSASCRVDVMAEETVLVDAAPGAHGVCQPDGTLYVSRCCGMRILFSKGVCLARPIIFHAIHREMPNRCYRH